MRHVAALAAGASATPFEGVLSDEDIVAVLSWIKSQWPPRIRQQQEEVTATHPSQG